MKTIKRLFLQTVFATVLLSSMIACETDCEPKETIVENKLTPEILSYFPYDSLDTIHCIIDSQQNMVMQSYTIVDGIEKYSEGVEIPCGPKEVYENHYRLVKYYDENGRIVFRAGLQLKSRTTMELDFDFYYVPIGENYDIIISTKTPQDTATINGHFYNDIYTRYSSTRDYTVYYSRSFGLVQITAYGKPLFLLKR